MLNISFGLSISFLPGWIVKAFVCFKTPAISPRQKGWFLGSNEIRSVDCYSHVPIIKLAVEE